MAVLDVVKVFDHGYLGLVETWGSDESIVEAARMSTDKGFEGWGPNTCDECGGADQSSLLMLGYPVCLTCKGTGRVPADKHYIEIVARATPLIKGVR